MARPEVNSKYQLNTEKKKETEKKTKQNKNQPLSSALCQINELENYHHVNEI